MILNLDNLDFTLKKYHSLCAAAAQSYSTITVAEYLVAQKMPENFLIMRHDIDRKPGSALNTAKIEAEFGIRATYYFRMNSSVFKPELIKKIESMGHEVGYHYEVLGKARGDKIKAIGLFEDELSEFRKICDIKTICMHGNPLSKYGDLDLWKSYDFRDFGIKGEAYLSIGRDVAYFSDTGRSWNSKNNIRDFMPGRCVESTASSTDDMIGLINGKSINRLYILTHPERWGNGMEWGLNYMMDFAFNAGKKMLVAVR